MDILSFTIGNMLIVVLWISLGFGLAMLCLHGITGLWRWIKRRGGEEMLEGLLKRLKEPSTYAGLASIVGLFGIHVAPETWTAIIAVLTAVAGLLAIILPEKAKPTV